MDRKSLEALPGSKAVWRRSRQEAHGECVVHKCFVNHKKDCRDFKDQNTEQFKLHLHQLTFTAVNGDLMQQGEKLTACFYPAAQICCSSVAGFRQVFDSV